MSEDITYHIRAKVSLDGNFDSDLRASFLCFDLDVTGSVLFALDQSPPQSDRDRGPFCLQQATRHAVSTCWHETTSRPDIAQSDESQTLLGIK